MKFFNWMQSKFNGAQGHKNSNAVSTAHHHTVKQEPRKEEFSDWPQGLLTIGTFGNNNNAIHVNEEEINNQETDQAATETSSPDLSDFTPEEVGKLQKELTNLLSKKKQDTIPADLPLDRFLNCPSSLEVDRRLSMRLNSGEGGNDDKEEMDRTIRVILGRCKDICTVDNTKKAIIGKKSLSFLFKKIFVCSSGFPTSPIPASLSDHHPLPESRMEKLLRAMLKHKINNPQNSQSSSARKFIDGRRAPCRKGEEVLRGEENERNNTKWVKTDSEYIVLEI